MKKIVYLLLMITIVSCQKEFSIPGDNHKPPVLNRPHSDSVPSFSAIVISGITQVRASVHTGMSNFSYVLEYGVVYSTSPAVTLENGTVVQGTGDSINLRLTLGHPNTTYYLNTYAKTASGVIYGKEVSFTTHVIKIGDRFEGGIVFYIDSSGLHGLIAAEQGQNYSDRWGCSISIDTKTEIGSGKSNTSLISKTCNSGGAAQWSQNLQYNSFYDWYLPSKDELLQMYSRRDIVVMNNATRWSSSQIDAKTAWAVGIDASGSPVAIATSKNSTAGVRPIRQFNY